MILSLRLEAILEQLKLYGPCQTLADIGCDHAFTGIEAVKRGYARRAIASDVRTGPLERAKRHIQETGHEELFEVRLSDGLSAFREGEADAILISGMGGDLITRILEQDAAVARAADILILQPQKDYQILRNHLRNGYEIIDEDMVCEDGKYYWIMTVRPDMAKSPKIPDDAVKNALEDTFGHILLEKMHPVFKAYLDQLLVKEELVLDNIRSNSKDRKREAEIEEYISLINEARSRWQ